MAESDLSRSGVHLRAVEDGDVEVFFEHQLDPVAVLMADFPARERDAFFAHWDKIRTDGTVLAQTIVVDGEVAGNVVSWDWDQAGTREVGYWIGRAYWGRGIATRALALFLGRMTSRPVYAYVAAHNLGSIRVLEKCGFHQTSAQDGQPCAIGPDEVEEVELVLAPAPEVTGPLPLHGSRLLESGSAAPPTIGGTVPAQA
jgi:RimJ/RimL family protein N-acetyltransferase